MNDHKRLELDISEVRADIVLLYKSFNQATQTLANAENALRMLGCTKVQMAGGHFEWNTAPLLGRISKLEESVREQEAALEKHGYIKREASGMIWYEKISDLVPKRGK